MIVLLLYVQHWRKTKTSNGKDRDDFPEVIAEYGVTYCGCNEETEEDLE
jgi:hypothetical protein